MIFLIALLITLFIASIYMVFTRKRIEAFTFVNWLPPIFIFLLIFGLVLMLFSANDISKSLIRHSWPELMASVVDLEIVGDRAYSPQLKCEYQVEGKIYTLTTDLKTPGFGRKKTRRQTSEIILDEYSIGSKVRIRYNPEHPGEAYIRTGPYWSDYLKISFSVILSSIGLIGMAAIFLNRNYKKKHRIRK